MADRSDDLASRVESLEAQLRGIAERLERLETIEHGTVVPEPLSVPPAPEVLTAASSLGALPLMGRTLVALGGGYLVRAMTDAAVIPPIGGVALGLSYALLWLVMADRAAAAGRRASASVHGLTAGLIAYPLLWETTTRFQLLRPATALALLGGVFVASVLVARRHDLVPVAWTSTALALGTGASLFVATRHLLAADLCLLAIVVVVEWLALHDCWPGLRWPAAVVVDGAFLVTIWLVSRREGLPEAYPPVALGAAVATALGLPALYLASVVARTLLRGQAVGPFDVLQTPASFVLGVGGAWRMLAVHGAPGASLGVLTMLIGAMCYAAAFTFVERRRGHDRNFYFYSTAGGLLLLGGSAPILARTPLTTLWCLLSLAGAFLGRHFDRMTLRFHGALYACAAGIAAGLPGLPWHASPAPTGQGVMALVTACACYLILAGERGRPADFDRRLPQAITAALATWTLGGSLTAALATALPSAAADPAVAATFRTAVLSGIVLGLAAAARRWALPELGWLVYPLLAIGGFGLVTEDLARGRPATQFLSLALYGGTLIVAPRQSKRAT
jgi:hypothetical protein